MSDWVVIFAANSIDIDLYVESIYLCLEILCMYFSQKCKKQFSRVMVVATTDIKKMYGEG